MIPLALFFALLFAFSLVSRRLEGTIVTAPMVFTTAGMLMFPALPWIMSAGFNKNVFLRLAEIGLVLLLFTDASRTELDTLRSIGSLPVRLLSIGMLLTIAFGAVVARLVFPQLSLLEAGILSTILAPTDAGLGQVVVNRLACTVARPRGAQRGSGPQRRTFGPVSPVLHRSGGRQDRRRGSEPDAIHRGTAWLRNAGRSNIGSAADG